MMKKLVLLSALCLAFFAHAQTNDSIRQLPFFLHPSKKMPDFELNEKKEGSFVTGLPRFEFDPIRGFGVGGTVNFFVNGTKDDPFFAYTPYRHKLTTEFFIYENGRVKYAFNYDVPYIFDTKWRLRADAVLWEDPDAQYWGIGRNTLNPLEFEDKINGGVRRFRTVNSYDRNLAIALPGAGGQLFTDFHFNTMRQREHLYNLLAERTFMGGRMRFMFGYEALFTNFQSYAGRIAEEAFLPDGTPVEAINNPTLIDIQSADGTWDRFNLSGFTNDNKFQFTSMLATALIYDTRDFEPDPSKGLFLEYSQEVSLPALGSDFSFMKFMVQGQYVHTLAKWRGDKSRITFAGLAALGHIFGSNINFIEMWDLSSQAEAGGILVLGGERSLRGYREARFLAPTVTLVNLEMRGRFYDFKMLRQHFTLGATAFYDMGSVYEGLEHLTFANWKGAPGLGARIGWNESTVIRLDYAVSREGSQVFFGFGHIF